MSTIEILAIIFAVITILKAIAFFAMGDKFSKLANLVSKNINVWKGVLVVLIVVVGYLILTNLSIVQVVSTLLFAHLLIGLFLIQSEKSYLTMSKEIIKDRKKYWLVWIPYLVLAIWLLVSFFV